MAEAQDQDEEALAESPPGKTRVIYSHQVPATYQRGEPKGCGVWGLRQPRDTTTTIVGTVGPLNRFWYI